MVSFLELIKYFQVHLERKTREAEFLTARLVEESEKRMAEAERLKAELVAAKVAEKQAKEKLLNFLSRTSAGSMPPVSEDTAIDVYRVVACDGIMEFYSQIFYYFNLNSDRIS